MLVEKSGIMAVIRFCQGITLASLLLAVCEGYSSSAFLRMSATESSGRNADKSRRVFFSQSLASLGTIATVATLQAAPAPANAVGPIRLDLVNAKYTAKPCPRDRPIPGEKAMKGMRGLCVTVQADLKDIVPKELEKIGVYGFVTDAITTESVLANNPDLSSDAGQFAMIESVKPGDKQVVFDFVAAVPMEKDITKFENGIGELNFASLRIVSYPGGQQYGAISPCEMDEFSMECDEWEEENGPYKKADYMVKSNSRTKGR